MLIRIERARQLRSRRAGLAMPVPRARPRVPAWCASMATGDRAPLPMRLRRRGERALPRALFFHTQSHPSTASTPQVFRVGPAARALWVECAEGRDGALPPAKNYTVCFQSSAPAACYSLRDYNCYSLRDYKHEGQQPSCALFLEQSRFEFSIMMIQTTRACHQRASLELAKYSFLN